MGEFRSPGHRYLAYAGTLLTAALGFLVLSNPVVSSPVAAPAYRCWVDGEGFRYKCHGSSLL